MLEYALDDGKYEYNDKYTFPGDMGFKLAAISIDSMYVPDHEPQLGPDSAEYYSGESKKEWKGLGTGEFLRNVCDGRPDECSRSNGYESPYECGRPYSSNRPSKPIPDEISCFGYD
jgi:hypothetical protein